MGLWVRNPMYLAAINRGIPPAGSNTYRYTVPRRTSTTAGDVTTFLFVQATWSAANSPDLLYQFEPTDEWRVFRRPKRQQGAGIWPPLLYLLCIGTTAQH